MLPYLLHHFIVAIRCQGSQKASSCCKMVTLRTPQGIINFNINDVLNKNKNKPNEPMTTLPKKDVIISLPYIGLRSNHITKRLKSCVNRFYSFVNVKSSISQNTRRIKSFFPYKDRLNRTQLSKVKVTIIKLVAGTAIIYYTGKTKRRLHDRKTKHFKALSKSDHSSAIADHIKWDHFDILASGKTDYHCKVNS